MTFPPPQRGVTFIRSCRGHYHVCFELICDDPDDDEIVDMSFCLTLEQATNRLLEIK